jgi:hypothetical protein
MLKMNHYPDLSQISRVNHLLFDIGYSWALLERTKDVLREIVLCDDYPVEVAELLAAIKEFQAGRLQVRSELYENAAAAAEKGLVDNE